VVATLQVFKGDEQVDQLKVNAAPVVIFGRVDTCDVQLDHGSISRRHAAIAHDEDGAVYIIDMNATHGTKLNGTPLRPNKRTKLAHGDEIRFGASTRRYKVDLGAPRKPSAPKAAKQEAEQAKEETAEEWAARKMAEMEKKKELEAEAERVAESKKRKHDDDEAGAAEVGDAHAGVGAADAGADGTQDADVVDPAEEEERKRKRTEANRATRERKKLARKQKYKDMKAESKHKKFRKKNWVPKEKTDLQRMAEICGQPTW